MNRFCRDTGVGIIPWSPLYGGILARPVGVKESIRSKGRNPIGSAFTEADEAVVNRVEQLAKEKGWKMTHVALAWLRSKGAVPIVGVNSVERLDDAVEIRGKSLTEKEIEFLEELYVPKPIAGHF
ncbi:hypothetical protein PENOC_112500 [Penicillium occitanis (nom. inval.)]|nr:hypothetical protein PENOC_112500 [Penicillium occitanis (nom. inval.)]